MKLQIAFDHADLAASLEIAREVAEFADMIEVDSLLIYKYGIAAVRSFKETFPDKLIFADAKIVDRGAEAMALFAKSGCDWASVMAGTAKHVIHGAANAAHEKGKKIILDLQDTSSIGQSALEAKSLGADAILFHMPTDNTTETLQEQWEMTKGNTTLPIYISIRQLARERIPEIIALNPTGIVLGSLITDADHPRDEAQFYYNLIKEIEPNLESPVV